MQMFHTSVYVEMEQNKTILTFLIWYFHLFSSLVSTDAIIFFSRDESLEVKKGTKLKYKIQQGWENKIKNFTRQISLKLNAIQFR